MALATPGPRCCGCCGSSVLPPIFTVGSTVTVCWRLRVDEGMRAALSAGASVVYDGRAWEVAELTPPSVLLAGSAGELRRVNISHLLAAPVTRVSEAGAGDDSLEAG